MEIKCSIVPSVIHPFELLRLLCAEQFPLYGVHKTCEMRPQITARRSRTKVESECFAYTREVRPARRVLSRLYRQISSILYRLRAEDVVAHVAVVRTSIVPPAQRAIVRNVFWSDPNLDDAAMAPFVWLVRGINAHVPLTIRSTCPASLIAALRVHMYIRYIPSALCRFFLLCSPPILRPRECVSAKVITRATSRKPRPHR